ncbi:MAG: hypothetical protein IPI52_11930 [Bacteroidetes bacterium]|nr:hypothetical protein [Bacteroidota bacterium]
MHFTNVISNLFDNALKYNDKTPFIEINTENLNRQIQNYYKGQWRRIE